MSVARATLAAYPNFGRSTHYLTGDFMVSDRSISLGCIAAYGLWGLSVTLLVWSVVASSLSPRTFVTMQNAAVVFAAGGGVATIRSYFVAQNRMMRNAFDLAKDAAPADRVPTPLRPR